METPALPELPAYPTVFAAPPVFVTSGRSRWLALLSSLTVALLFALGLEIKTHVPFFGAGPPLFMWRFWCFQPLILATAAPLLILVPAHLPVALRRVPAGVKTRVVAVVLVLTGVSLVVGVAGWHARVGIRSALLVSAGHLTPPAGFTAAGRPELGATPHAQDAAPETWQLWVPTLASTDPCAALLAAFTPIQGWQVNSSGSACAAIRRAGRVVIVVNGWTASALRSASGWPGVPSRPGITAEVGPNDGYWP